MEWRYRGNMSTAAVVIIGNEILAGKFEDENTPFFVRRLRELGVDLKRAVVVPDEFEAIGEEIRRDSVAYDHVFSSGGVGPTHDDITIEAIARAFGEALVPHPELVEILYKVWPDGPPAPALRMASVPENTQLLWEGDMRFPLLCVRNVVIFPGVPRLLQRKFEAAAHLWTGEPVCAAAVETEESEVDIAERLSEMQSRCPQLQIGSYPRRDESGGHYVIVTIEGRDSAAVTDCAGALREILRERGQ
jgi:molybdenum cofactor synthesis domain-containing protein